MDCLNIGLIGYGVVGQGVVKALKSRRKFLREKYETDPLQLNGFSHHAKLMGEFP